MDTVGDPKKYQDKLTEHFHHKISFLVSKKADALYKCVSAASIVAKVLWSPLFFLSLGHKRPSYWRYSHQSNSTSLLFPLQYYNRIRLSFWYSLVPLFLPSRPRNKEVAQWQSPSCVWLSLLCTIQLVYCRWTPQETRGEESHLVSLYAHLFTSRPEDEEGTYAPKKKSQVLKYRPSFFEKRGIDRAPFF